MLAIFTSEKEAVEFSNKIHSFLKANRPNYKADRWSDINKSDKEEKWVVKVPDDYEKWPVKMEINKTAIQVIATELSKVFMCTWKEVNKLNDESIQ